MTVHALHEEQKLTKREMEIVVGSLRVMLSAVPKVPLLLRIATPEEIKTLLRKFGDPLMESEDAGSH